MQMKFILQHPADKAQQWARWTRRKRDNITSKAVKGGYWNKEMLSNNWHTFSKEGLLFCFHGFFIVHKRQCYFTNSLSEILQPLLVATSFAFLTDLWFRLMIMRVCLPEHFAKLWSQDQVWNFWAISGITNPHHTNRDQNVYNNLLKGCWEFPFPDLNRSINRTFTSSLQGKRVYIWFWGELRGEWLQRGQTDRPAGLT